MSHNSQVENVARCGSAFLRAQPALDCGSRAAAFRAGRMNVKAVAALPRSKAQAYQK